MAPKAILTTAVITLIATLTLQGCGTVAGAGRDVSSAGKTITNTANDSGGY